MLVLEGSATISEIALWTRRSFCQFRQRAEQANELFKHECEMEMAVAAAKDGSAVVPPASANAPRQASAAKGLPPKITNSIDMKIVLIPAGTFLMGSAAGRKEESPVHEVALSRYYYMVV